MQPPSGGPGELRGPGAAAATDATMRRGCRRSRRSDGAKQRRRKARSGNKAVARRRYRGASSFSTPPVVRPVGPRGGVRRRWATTTAMRGQELLSETCDQTGVLQFPHLETALASAGANSCVGAEEALFS